MQIFEGGQVIVLGDAAALADEPRFGAWKPYIVVGLIAALAPLPVATTLQPALASSAGTFALLEGCSLLAFAGWYALGSVWTGELVASAFHRGPAMVEIVSSSIFGRARREVAFRDIRAIRLSRGEWDGESVVTHPVLQLTSGETIVLPADITEHDFQLLKVMTGIRGR